MVDIPYQNVIDYFNNFSCYRNVIVKNSSAKGTGSYIEESMVSFVSKCNMRVVKRSLLVCLSEYLPLSSVYILVIQVQVFFLQGVMNRHG